jgi:hypothetical protein
MCQWGGHPAECCYALELPFRQRGIAIKDLIVLILPSWHDSILGLTAPLAH